MYNEINYVKIKYIRKDVIPLALNENIKNARLKKKMTQRELGQAIGVSHNAISDWESGNHKPDADTVMALCKVLDVDANYMLDWEEKVAASNVKDVLEKVLRENDFFEGDDLTEENLDKLIKFINANKDFIINKKD